MRRLMRSPLLCLLLALLVCLPFGQAEAEGKLTTLPEIFKVKLTGEERFLSNKTQYIYKEYLTTSNPAVDEAIRLVVDGMDSAYSPLLIPQSQQKPKLYNRLDIEVNYSRTGESWLSTLIFARNTYKRQQKDLAFATGTYDLATGALITLEDIFPERSPAWGLMSERVWRHLSAIFPAEARDSAVVEALCDRETLRRTAFTLGGVELTLHIPLQALFPDKMGLAHVRFFYPEFTGMMTQEAARQTDNSRFKMVALTFDDGPRSTNTDKSINALRRNGMRATFFTVGKLYDNNLRYLLREFDANHLIANHSWDHWNGHGLNPRTRLDQVKRVQDYLLATLGEAPKYFRAPVGTYPPWIEAEIGLPIIQWSVDTYDFKGLSARDILGNIRRNVQDGDIILMHDTGEILNTALDGIADYLWSNGYMSVSVEELAFINKVDMQANVVYHRLYQGDFSPRRDSNTN